MDWNMNLNNDQIWTLVVGILFGVSEVLGMVKRGPNGILHAVWKFYNLKVEVEYEEDAGMLEEERVNQTMIPDRESIVMEESRVGDGNVSPNVLLIKNSK
jgi:hypothetical protein